MKTSHLSVLMQIPRLTLTAISSILYLPTRDDVYNLQETPQYRQHMHHSNPDKQLECQEVDVLYVVWSSLPQMS